MNNVKIKINLPAVKLAITTILKKKTKMWIKVCKASHQNNKKIIYRIIFTHKTKDCWIIKRN